MDNSNIPKPYNMRYTDKEWEYVLNNEVWRDVVGYEGSYEVSSFGRVKTVKRAVIKSNGKPYNISEKLKTGINPNKVYCVVALTLSGKSKCRYVHQLVVESFLGLFSDGNKIVIDHYDNNGHNNQLDNLQVVPQRWNARKDYKGNSSNYLGVSWGNKSKKWEAHIKIDGEYLRIGRFDTEKEARENYIKKRWEVLEKENIDYEKKCHFIDPLDNPFKMREVMRKIKKMDSLKV
tara:strand:- start:2449 stop:3147 length:699 start_codon:yes stop_codon:yes gene_type:complete